MKSRGSTFLGCIKLALFSIFLLSVSGCYVPREPGSLEYAYDFYGLNLYPNKPIYLAHNIWYADPMNINALNYHSGKIIPFGSEIIFLKAEKDYVIFRVQGSAQEYKIANDRTITLLKDKDMFGQIFTQEGDPTLKFKDMNSAVLNDMKKGIVSLGMSREQVLVTYGPAPKYINQLSEITWVYLINPQLKTTHLVFKDNKVNYIFEN
jgi:hypothetical protein